MIVYLRIGFRVGDPLLRRNPELAPQDFRNMIPHHIGIGYCMMYGLIVLDRPRPIHVLPLKLLLVRSFTYSLWGSTFRWVLLRASSWIDKDQMGYEVGRASLSSSCRYLN